MGRNLSTMSATVDTIIPKHPRNDINNKLVEIQINKGVLIKDVRNQKPTIIINQ